VSFLKKYLVLNCLVSTDIIVGDFRVQSLSVD